MTGQGAVYLNNKFVPLAKAAVSVLDMGLQRGLGASEVLRTYDRELFAPAAHLRRLDKSLKLLGLRQFPHSFLLRIMKRGVTRVSGEVLIKILVTAGPGYQLEAFGKPCLIIIFSPFRPHPQREYRTGLWLMTSIYQPALPQAKSLNYLAGVLAHRKAKRRGMDEALFIDGADRISEGTTFNFAVIRGKKIITPSTGVLPGVTMGIVLKLAKRCGLRVDRRPIRHAELKRADEAFVTSTIREVMPVVRVDRIRINSGRPGKYAKMILETFWDYARNKNSKISERFFVGSGHVRLSGRGRY